MDVRWFDPFAAFERRTVDAVFRVVFLVFAVPLHFELDIEQLVNVSEWDVLWATTFRWHVLRIFHGHLEYALQTVVAHAVVTGQSRRLVGWDVIGSASQAFN